MIRDIVEKHKTSRAPRKQLIMAASMADEGPWCSVSLVKFIEIQGANPLSRFIVHRRDATMDSAPVSIHITGNERKPVNIPRGEIKIERIKTQHEPITVYAYCGS